MESSALEVLRGLRLSLDTIHLDLGALNQSIDYPVGALTFPGRLGGPPVSPDCIVKSQDCQDRGGAIINKKGTKERKKRKGSGDMLTTSSADR